MGKTSRRRKRRQRNRYRPYPGYAYRATDATGRRYWASGTRYDIEKKEWVQGPYNWAPTAPLYFAYGSNLNMSQMDERCPEATPFRRLLLPNWKLIFRGVADITPCAGAAVQGGLWRITGADEAALDQYEGVKSGFYFKEYFTVTYPEPGTGENVTEDVLFYMMGSDERHSPPGEYYLGSIRQGFKDFGLDETYLDAAVAEAPEPETKTYNWKDQRYRPKAVEAPTPHYAARREDETPKSWPIERDIPDTPPFCYHDGPKYEADDDNEKLSQAELREKLRAAEEEDNQDWNGSHWYLGYD